MKKNASNNLLYSGSLNDTSLCNRPYLNDRITDYSDKLVSLYHSNPYNCPNCHGLCVTATCPGILQECIALPGYCDKLIGGVS